MKEIIKLLMAVIIVVGIVAVLRFHVIINSPIVAKIDRLTGDVWIVNSGVWKKIAMPVESRPAPVIPDTVHKTEKK